MIIHQYKCQLLSEVIISSDTASEGQKRTLSYLPGAKFLGIASGQLYNDEEASHQQTLDLFHNGTVSFGDAHPALASTYALQVPFAWFYPKGEKVDEGVYIHHELDEQKRKEILRDEIQLKQARSGYFATTGEYLPAIPQEFSIKSAYDRERRRAKDEQMYGYFSLPKGSEWLFTVEDRSGQYGEVIRKALEGRHRIGRSRSAEYGLVEIKFDKEFAAYMDEQSPTSRLVCYAESDWLFYDEYGQTTLQPDPIVHFGLPVGTVVDWSQSQIRSRLYQSWNSKRYNRDADRHIIEKGAVMVFQTPTPIKPSVQMRVGAQQAQGFGRVRVNPDFLKGNADGKLRGMVLKKIEENGWPSSSTPPYSSVTKGKNDGLILQHLKVRREATKTVMSVDDLVNFFMDTHGGKFGGISASQWGMVRNYSKHAENLGAFKNLLFEEGVGCLTRGQSEAEWRKQKRRETLKNFLFENERMPEAYIIPFIIKLATEMAKKKEKGHE